MNYGTDFRIGACMVAGATGISDAPTGYRHGQISATARTGAGAYTVTIQQGADQFETQANLQVEGGAGNTNVQLAWTSDVLLTVTSFVAAVATDATFKLSLERTRP